MAAALAGRRDAFVSLYERHYGAAVRLAAAWCELDGLERLTLAEEVFARAFTQLHLLREPARFTSFLLMIARQSARARVERRRGLRPFVGEFERFVELAPEPGFSLAAAQAKVLLEETPGGQRALAQEFYRDGGVTLGELALRSGVSPAAAERQVEGLRARLKLRLAAELLSRRGPQPELSREPQGPSHVRRESWEKILRGERMEGEAALAAHFRSTCEVCQQRTAEMAGIDGLDGDVDRALLGLGQKPLPTPSDASFERVMRRMRLDSRTGARGLALPALRPRMVLPLSLAGLLALAGISILLLQRVPPARVVSPGEGASGPEVELTFSVASRTVGREAAVPGEPGASLSEGQELILHYRLAHPAFVTLVQVRPGGVAETLAQPGRMSAGPHELAVNEAKVRVSLAGARGVNRFIALATEAPLSGEALRRALGALGNEGADAKLGPSAASDEFEVSVGP